LSTPGASPDMIRVSSIKVAFRASAVRLQFQSKLGKIDAQVSSELWIVIFAFDRKPLGKSQRKPHGDPCVDEITVHARTCSPTTICSTSVLEKRFVESRFWLLVLAP
jgi:hypothetical protein